MQIVYGERRVLSSNSAAGLGGPHAARARILLSRTIRIRYVAEQLSLLRRWQRLPLQQ